MIKFLLTLPPKTNVLSITWRVILKGLSLMTDKRGGGVMLGIPKGFPPSTSE